ncbi:MAG TPA: hypothetical protein VGN88_07215 [Phycisphaerae bacterium]|jgi:hypothetical protein
MQIELTYTWTFPEFVQYNRAHVHALKQIPLKHNSALIASRTLEHKLLLTSVGIVTLVAYLGLAYAFGSSFIVFLGGTGLLVPFIWMKMKPSERHSVRDAWLNSLDSNQLVTYSISDTHISRSILGSQLTLEWTSTRTIPSSSSSMAHTSPASYSNAASNPPLTSSPSRTAAIKSPNPQSTPFLSNYLKFLPRLKA